MNPFLGRFLATVAGTIAGMMVLYLMASGYMYYVQKNADHEVTPILSSPVAVPTGAQAQTAQPVDTTTQNEAALPKSVIWEVPPGTDDVVVQIYNADNSFKTSYTITNYISVEAGQKIKVIAHIPKAQP